MTTVEITIRVGILRTTPEIKKSYKIGKKYDAAIIKKTNETMEKKNNGLSSRIKVRIILIALYPSE